MSPLESSEPSFFSVIVPTYNRRQILRQTLQALGRQDYPPDRFEALVIVDGGTDGTDQMLESLHSSFSLRTFFQARKGPAAARNTGIQNAYGKFVLFLDDDTIPTPSLLREHAKRQASGKNLVVRGRYLLHPASPPSTTRENHRQEDAIYWNQLTQGLQFPEDAVCDANTSVPIELLKDAGGYDERFLFQRENVELGYRLHRAGGHFVYHPEALVYHYYLKTEKDLVQDSYLRGRSDFLLMDKHPDYGGTRELESFFYAGWSQTAIRRALWQFPEAFQKISNWVFGGLAPIFPGLTRTRGLLNRVQRFCAYSKGLKDAGATWNGLAGRLQSRKRSLKPQRF